MGLIRSGSRIDMVLEPPPLLGTEVDVLAGRPPGLLRTLIIRAKKEGG